MRLAVWPVISCANGCCPAGLSCGISASLKLRKHFLVARYACEEDTHPVGFGRGRSPEKCKNAWAGQSLAEGSSRSLMGEEEN